MDDLFNISIKDINRVTDFIANFDMNELSFGEQLLILSAQATMVKSILPIVDKHSNDIKLQTYKINKVNKRK